MKQFLRHIFLLLALFMATANAWAECYVYGPTGEYNTTIGSNMGEFPLPEGGAGGVLSFKYKVGKGVFNNNASYYHYATPQWSATGNIGSWNDLSSAKTKSKDYGDSPHMVTIPKDAKYIRFHASADAGGSRNVYIKEIKVTRVSFANPPAHTEWDAGKDILNSEAITASTTMDWSNTAPFSITVSGSSQFTAKIENNAINDGCSAGTATISATYSHNQVGEHTATITLSNGVYTYTIALSGVTGKYTPQAAKKMDMVMNESYNTSDIFDVYYLANNVKNTISDYTVKALDPTIANYVGGKIVTNYQTGTARFQLTHDADTNFDALNETISVNVNPAGGCLVLEPCSGSCDVPIGEDFIPVDLTGPADYLSFQARKEAGSAVGNIEIKQYVNNEWKFIDDANPGTDWRDYGYTLDEFATKVGFFTSGGSYHRYFQNVQVTRKAYLRPSTIELTLPQTNIGKSSEKTFDLSWSTCSDDIKLVSNNDLFEVGTTQINAAAHTGTTNNILVRFKGANESGTYSAVITIYDQSQSKEVDVSCVVKAKLTTEIIYTGEATYPETPDGIPYPFYVKDENGNTVQGAKITLETSNKDILSFDATKIYPHCGGYVTLTATYAGDETHEPASKEQTIFVPECYQYIVWNQDLRGFLTDDNGTINEIVELTAYAATESGVKTGTPVVYSLDTEAEKIAKLIDNHNGTYSLNVFGKGEGTITASISEYTFDGEQYYPNDYTRIIRVHKKGDPCEPYSLSDENEYAISMWNTTKILLLEGLPENTMTIMAHAAVSSYENDLTVDFSTEETGDNWIGKQTQNIHSGSKNEKYTFSVPEKAKRVRFKSWSTINTYFHNTYIRQKTYLTPSVTGININSIVNQEYSYSFDLEYSNMPFVQYSVTNNHNLGFLITPGNEDINTFCDDSGTIHFTITGMSLIPHEALTETLTITTAAGEQIPIPITIDASLLETYSFDKQDGGYWSDPANWTVNGNTPSTLPTASNPVVVSRKVTIDNQAVAYGIEMQEGGYINIHSTGGLTVHAGGYTTSSQEHDLEITIDNKHAGYFRMSPLAKTEMPKAQVNFTTRGQLNGGNKDAAWQYIGAPGSGVGMDLAHTTVLYLRSEEKGWVRQYTEWAQLTPFAGYALTQKEQETFTLYPQLLNENITISLTYTENGMRGDNLWANSYAAPLDITKFTPEDFSGEVDQTFYLYNSGSWNQWDANQNATTDATVTPGRYYAINQAKIDQTKDQTVIPPMQGVYMKANSGGGTITLNYEKHVWNNTQTARMNTPLRVAGKEGETHTQSFDFQRVRLQVNSENSGADRMYIIQDSVATAGYDNGYDAPKLMADGLINIYTNEPCGKMEISSTDHMDGMYIGFQAGEDDVYTMTFTSLIGDDLYLYDLEQDTLIGMIDGGKYEFTAAAKSTNDMRFQILVNPDLNDYLPNGGNGDGVTTDIYDVQAQQLWVQDEKVYIAHASANSILEVYTASGMPVARYAIGYAPCTLDLSDMPTGVYMLRLNDKVYKFICK